MIHTDSSGTQGQLRATKCSFPMEKGTVHQRVTGSVGGAWGPAREPAAPATGVGGTPLLSQIVFSSGKGEQKLAPTPEGFPGPNAATAVKGQTPRMCRPRDSGDQLLAMTLMMVTTMMFLRLEEEAQSGWPWIPEAFRLLLSCL